MLQNFTILRQNLKNMGSSYQVKAKEKKNKNLSHIILLIFQLSDYSCFNSNNKKS